MDYNDGHHLRGVRVGRGTPPDPFRVLPASPEHARRRARSEVAMTRSSNEAAPLAMPVATRLRRTATTSSAAREPRGAPLWPRRPRPRRRRPRGGDGRAGSPSATRGSARWPPCSSHASAPRATGARRCGGAKRSDATGRGRGQRSRLRWQAARSTAGGRAVGDSAAGFERARETCGTGAGPRASAWRSAAPIPWERRERRVSVWAPRRRHLLGDGGGVRGDKRGRRAPRAGARRGGGGGARGRGSARTATAAAGGGRRQRQRARRGERRQAGGTPVAARRSAARHGHGARVRGARPPPRPFKL